MSTFDLFNRPDYTSNSAYGSSSSAPTQSERSRYIAPTPAEIAAAVAPTKYAPVDLTKYSCDNPYDLEDLYYYVSPKNGQKGPYIPQLTDRDIRDYARIRDGRTIWTQRTIPNTSATGCVSQDLGGYFGVRVDGLNKVIIDAYNAQFPNPPTPVPLKTKYFYYTRFINRDTSKEYFPARFTYSLRKSLTLNKNSKIRCDDLISDACWGELQKLPNTNAMGFVIIDGEGQGALMYVRVDRANNAIIEAYNESLNSLPPGWEELKEPSGRIYYGNPALKIVQYAFPTPPSSSSSASAPPSSTSSASAPPSSTSSASAPPSSSSSASAPPSSTSSAPTPSSTSSPVAAPPPAAPVPAPSSSNNVNDTLPSGWVKHVDAKGRSFYVNKDLNKKQWELPSSPAPLSNPAPVQPMVPAPASTSTPLPPGWEELKEPSGRVYYGNPALKIIQYARPMLFEMNGHTFSSMNELMHGIYSSCSTGAAASKCEVAATPSAAGGAKNKKRRTKRRHKASRRKASRRKASRRKASRRKASRRSTGKK